MWETDEWELAELVAREAGPGPLDPVTIDGQEVDEARVKLRRPSRDPAWRAYLDGALLPPGTVIRSGETVVHVQPKGG
jgi:hypothetical protein